MLTASFQRSAARLSTPSGSRRCRWRGNRGPVADDQQSSPCAAPEGGSIGYACPPLTRTALLRRQGPVKLALTSIRASLPDVSNLNTALRLFLVRTPRSTSRTIAAIV